MVRLGDFFAIMYHYVRPAEASNLRILTIDNFVSQLNYIEKNFGFVNRQDWFHYQNTGELPSGALLTFDDGLKDHFNFVLPELEKRGLFAIFYVCTNPLQGFPLAVHLSHAILANKSISEVLKSFSDDFKDMTMNLDRKAMLAYVNQDYSELEKNFKRAINWSLNRVEFQHVLLETFSKITGKSNTEFLNEWYLNENEIKHISQRGFEIGSHSCSHNLMIDLDDLNLFYELSQSKQILQDVTGEDIKSFAYPFGGEDSYRKAIFTVLQQVGYKDAISVNPLPIKDFQNLSSYNYELPRFDCNLFPFGTWKKL